MTHQQSWESCLKWLDEVQRDAGRCARSWKSLDEKVKAHRLKRELDQVRTRLRLLVFGIEDVSVWREENGGPVYCGQCGSEVDSEGDSV
jgi:hypothetical protein